MHHICCTWSAFERLTVPVTDRSSSAVNLTPLPDERRNTMNPQERSNEVQVVRATPNLPVGGAVLDQHGEEVLITEEMVQAACQECDKNWVTPEK
ncbi:hypothetical protein N032_10030 [Pseudomonas syringae pv. pisi str. PP1]|uniref:Multifunctional fatty acid oxidation complex subunit alpha n=1 Tax=Pseudomonas syringae pv. syringae TaxID=321 RepID=A0AAE5S8W7_PSESY|nr:hypothetical protein N032_10030 [Pseudomonas syringae pv. pisi str. PP1]EPF65954.1 Hypothetical protein PssSM_1874 [Pseudomonas syringae pv. syringae SM]MCF5649639.1 hypothetical protein [Pseudomonas syringae]POQ04497.1 hypothetical protein CXB42_09470 [Pseudomonas syringae pv. syringae]MCF5732742.1 hypothetical protein [Pseudomonas syringae]